MIYHQIRTVFLAIFFLTNFSTNAQDMKKILDTWKKNITEEKELRHISSVYIFDEDERLLLIKRSKTADKHPNIWEVPGGHVDSDDDSYKSAAVREVKEETNLSVSNLKHVEDQEFHNRIKHIYVTGDYEGSVKIVPNPKTKSVFKFFLLLSSCSISILSIDLVPEIFFN